MLFRSRSPKREGRACVRHHPFGVLRGDAVLRNVLDVPFVPSEVHAYITYITICASVATHTGVTLVLRAFRRTRRQRTAFFGKGQVAGVAVAHWRYAPPVRRGLFVTLAVCFYRVGNEGCGGPDVPAHCDEVMPDGSVFDSGAGDSGARDSGVFDSGAGDSGLMIADPCPGGPYVSAAGSDSAAGTRAMPWQTPDGGCL